MFATKCTEPDAKYTKHISYGGANDELKYATLPDKFHLSASPFQSTNVTQT